MCDEGLPFTRGISDLAANVLGPLLTTFVAWTLNHASKNGVERLYFFLDGAPILLEIARVVSRYIQVPEIRWLYSSKECWFLSSIVHYERQNLDWVLAEGDSIDLNSALRKLNIAPAEISEQLKAINIHDGILALPLDGKNIENFWKLIEHPDVSALILEKAAIARELVIKYFAQEGLFDASRSAIVDVDWKSQYKRALKQLLDVPMLSGDVTCYYLYTLEKTETTLETGADHSFISLEDFRDKKHQKHGQLLSNSELIEEILRGTNYEVIADHRDDDGRIAPLIRSLAKNSSREQFLSQLYKDVLRYAEEVGKVGLLPDFIGVMKEHALRALEMFLNTPTRTEAQCIARIPIHDEQDQSHNIRLVRKLSLSDILALIACKVHPRNPSSFAYEYTWIEGSVVLSNPLIKILFQLFKLCRVFGARNYTLSSRN